MGSLEARANCRPLGVAGATLADLVESLGLTLRPIGDALAAVDLLVVRRPGEGVRNRFGAGREAAPELPVDAADMRAGDTVGVGREAAPKLPVDATDMRAGDTVGVGRVAAPELPVDATDMRAGDTVRDCDPDEA